MKSIMTGAPIQVAFFTVCCSKTPRGKCCSALEADHNRQIRSSTGDMYFRSKLDDITLPTLFSSLTFSKGSFEVSLKPLSLIKNNKDSS